MKALAGVLGEDGISIDVHCDFVIIILQIHLFQLIFFDLTF
jgi:hypothetical protein